MKTEADSKQVTTLSPMRRILRQSPGLAEIETADEFHVKDANGEFESFPLLDPAYSCMQSRP